VAIWVIVPILCFSWLLAPFQVRTAVPLPPASGSVQAVPSMRLSASGGYLVDPLDRPVFLAGDSPWSLIAGVSLEDANLYLENRAAKGFNVIMVNLIEAKFTSHAPRNYYNQPPFIRSGDFTTPNEDYFSHADAVINLAAQKGITVLLDPLYLGWECGDQGWCRDVRAAPGSQMQFWGRYLGNRYKDFPNIIWLIGADTNPFTYGVEGKLLEMVAGIKEYDTAHLMTAHTAPGSSAQDTWGRPFWLNLNTVYHYGIDALLSMAREQFRRPQALPLFMLESAYEREHDSTPASLRQQAYGGVLWGGTLGSFFGNCPLWSLGYNAGFCGPADWKAQLDSAGSVQFGYFASVMRSRRFWLLVPDHEHTVLTAGYGSGPALATTARASDGSSILAHIPTRRPVTIDMSKIADASGQAQCSWYNPRNGQATVIGTYPNRGSRTFTPPDDSDWLLLVDSTGAGAAGPLAAVSAASYVPGGSLAPGMIAAAYGDHLAPTVETAPPSGPLPTSLARTSVEIADSRGARFSAPLWFVSPRQINFLVPEQTALGPVTLNVVQDAQVVATGTLRLEAVAPGLFTMNADGRGVPAALAVSAKADGTTSWQYVFNAGCEAGSCQPVPIDLGSGSDQVYLQLYGTGIRGRSALAAVTAGIGGFEAPVEYAGPVAGMSGLDQVNLRLPGILRGSGEVDIVLSVDGRAANTVRVFLK
jgi:uncharacterized protein (TIGR03437 family)